MLGLLSSLSTTTTSSEIGDFLDQVYSHSNFPSQSQPPSTTEPIDLLACPGCNQRPFVTLTYAQSIDGKIAGADGQQLRLSGNQSMKMTHLPQHFYHRPIGQSTTTDRLRHRSTDSSGL
ncbi:hypothetical protein PtB15_1B496 [Puccinia triticina]|nr:hypothetical protein PtB15_1B496 [Puccinia triticina]